MGGWRAKLGLIVPYNNTIIEPELNALIPKGVSIHSTRIGKGPIDRPSTKEDLLQLREETDGVAETLKSAADAIAYCCMASSFITGQSGSAEIVRRIQRICNVPATTASSAMVSGLKELKINKVAVATPYSAEKNKILKSYMEESGFEVVNIAGPKILPSPREVCELPPHFVFRLARSVFKPEVDGVFIGSTDFPAMDMISALENDIEKPVVTVNQAILWDLLRMVGVKERIQGYGKLLETL
jgi:maleate cis-trans isomerase